MGLKIFQLLQVAEHRNLQIIMDWWCKIATLRYRTLYELLSKHLQLFEKAIQYIVSLQYEQSLSWYNLCHINLHIIFDAPLQILYTTTCLFQVII